MKIKLYQRIPIDSHFRAFRMFSRICLFAFLFGQSGELSGHEEPNKTLREKAQAAASRARIAHAHVRSMIQWKHALDNGVPTGEKTRTISQQYAADGRLILISAFRADSISESATYSYNPAGDMISDIDLTGAGGVAEANYFIYDREGRVMRGYGFDDSGVLTGRFEHTFDPSKRMILFTKYGVHDGLDYTIEYEYQADYDSIDYALAIKKDAAGTEVIRVEKLFDSSGRTAEKRVVQGEKKTVSGFRYSYSHDGIVEGIEKFDESGKVETTTRYGLNADGTYSEVETKDSNGKLISKLTFEYITISPDR